jgi:hypothetical protein
MLIERRAFSVPTGSIDHAAELVVATPRTEDAILIFNDLVIDVKTDDRPGDIVGRWNETRLAAIGSRQAA